MQKIAAALDALGKTAEVIYVDDGSTDKSLAILKEIAAGDDRVRVISSAAQLRPDSRDVRRHRRGAAAKF